MSMMSGSFSSSEHSFFYRYGAHLYHITYKEVPKTDYFSLDDDPVQDNNVYIFYHFLTDIQKFYKVFCRMLSPTFIFQFLNKLIYKIKFHQYEEQQQKISEKENLEKHLKKDFIHYLASKQNSCLDSTFFQDYVTYQGMTSSKYRYA